MKKFREWRLIYAVCCLVYWGWMINVGTNEFARINGQYRLIVEQLDGERIRTKALEELKTDCNKEFTLRADRDEDACLAWPPSVVKARVKAVEQRRIRAKERGTIKLVLFYTSFVFFFLLFPPLLIYLLIVGIIRLFLNIKIVK